MSECGFSKPAGARPGQSPAPPSLPEAQTRGGTPNGAALARPHSPRSSTQAHLQALCMPRPVRVVVEDGGEPLERPLLDADAAATGRRSPAGAAAEDGSPLPSPRGCGGGGCSAAGGMSNIVVTAVGAGMVALPHAVSEVGLALGLALFALTAALTLASTSIIVR